MKFFKLDLLRNKKFYYFLIINMIIGSYPASAIRGILGNLLYMEASSFQGKVITRSIAPRMIRSAAGPSRRLIDIALSLY